MCGLAVRDKSNLRRHEQTHLGLKLFSCPHCSKSFTRSWGLKEHLQVHMERIRNFVCLICHKAFYSRHRLQGHIQSHNPERALCSICGKTFPTKKSLSHHTKTVHSDNKPYQCIVCKKQFKTNGALTMHKRIHSDLRPFQCTQCDQAFKYKNVFEGHMKTHMSKINELEASLEDA